MEKGGKKKEVLMSKKLLDNNRRIEYFAKSVAETSGL
jgi:hypothetical protein